MGRLAAASLALGVRPSKRGSLRKPACPQPETEHDENSYRELMPDGARADGFWGGPMPPELAALGPLAAKIIRLVHVSCCMHSACEIVS